MAVATMQLLKTHADGVTYADPADPNCTVRFKVTTAPKTIGSETFDNYVLEIIQNDKAVIESSPLDAVEVLSNRVRTSGTADSVARRVQMLSDLTGKFAAWLSSENVAIGFPPTTAPINTTV